MLHEHKSKEKTIDCFVGKRLKIARLMMQLSQRELGEAVGLSFQQIQKFETGEIRIGAGRLKQLAEALDLSIQFFFEGVEAEYQCSSEEQSNCLNDHDEKKSNCINLIANASDGDVNILHDILQRLSNAS